MDALELFAIRGGEKGVNVFRERAEREKLLENDSERGNVFESFEVIQEEKFV